ncbi:MAG: hypothetical protein KF833_02055 [Verrucomicrobiae bacterium]|nr:hypothetical protein [Verrucomicrobiae bacterium]
MIRKAIVGGLVAGICAAGGWAGAEEQEGARNGRVGLPEAPPVAPPWMQRVSDAGAESLRRAGSSQHDMGDPSDEEQLYLEFINRARRDPRAEAERLAATSDPDVMSAIEFFSVDLELMKGQFETLAPAPPLALEARLTEAARRHSADMFEAEFQGHGGSDGSTSQQRIEGTGYPWNRFGENVFSYAQGVWHGHAGFNIDWGLGPGGIQEPPGHRLTIHNREFREIGIGVVLGRKGPVGPQLVTQVMASRNGLPALLTGVAYYDLDGDAFYGLGEGIGGVTVRLEGSGAETVTSRSGGYVVPLPGNGSHSVVFSAPGLPAETRVFEVTGGANVKVDFTPAYAPPQVEGPSVTGTGRDRTYSVTPVGAATGYDWRWRQYWPWTEPEGGEDGLGMLEASVAGGYAVVQGEVRQAGNAAFHLAHVEPIDQVLRVRSPVLIGVDSVLSFWSRLGWASSAQRARVQAMTNAATGWATLWEQAGTGNAGETSFVRREVPLSGLAGQMAELRFVYSTGRGNYFPQSDPGVGWYLDEIHVSDAARVGEATEGPVGEGRDLTFRPVSEGRFLLSARARIGDRVLPWGPDREVVAEEAPPGPSAVRLIRVERDGLGALLVRFVVEGGTAEALEMEAAGTVAGPWQSIDDPGVEPDEGAGAYRARVTLDGGVPARFFRVLAR